MPWTCDACGRACPDDSGYCGACGGRRSTRPPDDPRIGEEILGRYRITAKIGEGGMGTVYRAEQKMGTVTRPVAIKILLATHLRGPGLRTRFVRECEVVIRLEHPNTIKFFDFGELADGSLAIVMEHVAGESLASHLARGPLPVERALRIVGQISGSLHEAHSCGIVHRDLKPDNVLIRDVAGEPDMVKVLDFGIAKSHGSAEDRGGLTMQGTVLGTPEYMSPEQFAGGPLDARSDVYSLGVLAYEMLTGALPFPPGQTVFEWAERHLNAAPIPIDTHPVAAQLSTRARAVLMQALEKEPDRRPASVLEFARGLISKEELENGWGLATVRGVAAPRRPVMPTTPMPTSAPGLHLSPPVSTTTKAPARGAGRTIALLVAAGGMVGAAVAAGAYFLLFTEDAPEASLGTDAPATPLPPPSAPEPPPDPPAPPAAGAPIGPEPPGPVPPEQWLRIVHHEEAVDEASAATGPPDQRYARIASGGLLTLELLPGSVVGTDGGPGPDLYVAVDPSSPAPYRIEVASGHERFRVAVAEANGTLPLDLDQYRVGTVRYVRLSSRSLIPVLVDAVGVYGTSAPPHHDHH